MGTKKKRYAEFHTDRDNKIKQALNIESPYVDQGLVQYNERRIDRFFRYNRPPKEKENKR